MNIPAHTLCAIPAALDASGWHLEIDETDVKVYTKYQADARVLGFKTVTKHPVSLTAVVALLRDVCGAMHQINDLFVSGEQFQPWPVPVDSMGQLVRTSFKLPFPMSRREFLHGLHDQQLDEQTHLVAVYTCRRQSRSCATPLCALLHVLVGPTHYAISTRKRTSGTLDGLPFGWKHQHLCTRPLAPKIACQRMAKFEDSTLSSSYGTNQLCTTPCAGFEHPSRK